MELAALRLGTCDWLRSPSSSGATSRNGSSAGDGPGPAVAAAVPGGGKGWSESASRKVARLLGILDAGGELGDAPGMPMAADPRAGVPPPSTPLRRHDGTHSVSPQARSRSSDFAEGGVASSTWNGLPAWPHGGTTPLHPWEEGTTATTPTVPSLLNARPLPRPPRPTPLRAVHGGESIGGQQQQQQQRWGAAYCAATAGAAEAAAGEGAAELPLQFAQLSHAVPVDDLVAQLEAEMDQVERRYVSGSAGLGSPVRQRGSSGGGSGSGSWQRFGSSNGAALLLSSPLAIILQAAAAASPTRSSPLSGERPMSALPQLSVGAGDGAAEAQRSSSRALAGGAGGGGAHGSGLGPPATWALPRSVASSPLLSLVVALLGPEEPQASATAASAVAAGAAEPGYVRGAGGAAAGSSGSLGRWAAGAAEQPSPISALGGLPVPAARSLFREFKAAQEKGDEGDMQHWQQDEGGQKPVAPTAAVAVERPYGAAVAAAAAGTLAAPVGAMSTLLQALHGSSMLLPAAAAAPAVQDLEEGYPMQPHAVMPDSTGGSGLQHAQPAMTTAAAPVRPGSGSKGSLLAGPAASAHNNGAAAGGQLQWGPEGASVLGIDAERHALQRSFKGSPVEAAGLPSATTWPSPRQRAFSELQERLTGMQVKPVGSEARW